MLTWVNMSDTRPGYSIYHAEAGERTYVIQMKRGIGLWRLFMRDKPTDPLRTVFIGDTLAECKLIVEGREDNGH